MGHIYIYIIMGVVVVVVVVLFCFALFWMLAKFKVTLSNPLDRPLRQAKEAEVPTDPGPTK